VGTLVDRAPRLKGGGVDPRTDNMLKTTGDGRKAALDMRIIGPFTEIEGDTKLSRAFEHEARLRELLVKQAQLNAAFDLDKHEAQAVAEEPEKAVPASFAARVMAENRAAEMAP
jgi:hypothetical protein